MKIRRVLVANVDGRSRVVEDGEPPRTAVALHTPGFVQSLMWTTPPIPSTEHGGEPTVEASSFVPEPGGTRLILLTLPPDTVFMDPSFDPVAAGGETLRNAPGLAELFELDSPGMHTTPTVDYDVLLDGELWLELSDGEVQLTPGTVVVQHGTRHAWRNKSDKPATLLAVLIGADTSNNTEKEQ